MQKPQLEETTRFVYITQPKSGELLRLNADYLSKVDKVKVSARPYRLSVLGIESDQSH